MQEKIYMMPEKKRTPTSRVRAIQARRRSRLENDLPNTTHKRGKAKAGNLPLQEDGGPDEEMRKGWVMS